MGIPESTPVENRMNELGNPELAYVARWVAMTHPEVAESAMTAVAQFKRDYPDKARLMGMEV